MHPLQYRMQDSSVEAIWELFYEASTFDNEPTIVHWAERYARLGSPFNALMRHVIGTYQFKQARNSQDPSIRDEAHAAACIHIIGAARHAPDGFLMTPYDGTPSPNDLLSPVLGALQAHLYLQVNHVGDVRWCRAQEMLHPCVDRLVRLAVAAIPFPVERRVNAFRIAAEIMSGLEHRR